MAGNGVRISKARTQPLRQYVVRTAGVITAEGRTDGAVSVVADAVSVTGATLNEQRLILRSADGSFLSFGEWAPV